MAGSMLLYGTIAIDTLITPRGKAHSVLGGSGIYAALAARLLTSDMTLTGMVGDDFPREYLMAMEARGVSMRYVEQVPGEKTFAWTGQYEEDMNLRHTVRTEEGVQARHALVLPPELRHCRLAAATNVTPPLQCNMLEQCEDNPFVMSDFMQSWILREPEYTKKLLRMSDLALMNDEEARTFAHTDDSLEAGYFLLESGPRYVIVKHGSAGSTLFHRCPAGDVRLFRCPSWPLPHPEDPTGAGDSYMGALAGYLTGRLREGSPTWEDLTRGMAIATVVAGAVCERFGTVSLFGLTRHELAHRISAFHEMTRWE